MLLNLEKHGVNYKLVLRRHVKVILPPGEPSNLDTGTSGMCHKVILPETSPEKSTL